MLPLAEIVAAQGHLVAGSDRSLDQGRLNAKFEALQAKGIALFPQDGSGITSGDQIVIASAAVEASVPDIVRTTELGCIRQTRAELLAELFNAAPLSIAVGGTSGKSTVTGMVGWIMDQCGRDPTIMNGAVMKNYGSGSRVGAGDLFVSEVDESDGSIALYHPTVAVVNNVTIDHKSMDELRVLFGDFLARGGWSVANADDAEALALLNVHGGEMQMQFAIDAVPAPHNFVAQNIVEEPFRVAFDLVDGTMPLGRVQLQVPGRHNVSNALAALAACAAAGEPLVNSMKAIEDFSGLKRRFEKVGEANGITVIDDFGHNPDKIAATLQTLHAFPGRVLVFFQPHGFGPLKQMGRELADSFRANLRPEDVLVVCDPAYFGGTVDRSVGADALVTMIGPQAEHIPARSDCGDRLIEVAQPGDRIIVMGARDDTLSLFAQELVARLG